MAERHASFFGDRQKAGFFVWWNFRFRVKVAERYASFFREAPKGLLLYVGDFLGLGLKSPKGMLLFLGNRPKACFFI